VIVDVSIQRNLVKPERFEGAVRCNRRHGCPDSHHCLRLQARSGNLSCHRVCPGDKRLAVILRDRPDHSHVGTIHTIAVNTFHKTGQPGEVSCSGLNLRVRNTYQERIVQLRRCYRKNLQGLFRLAPAPCLRITASESGEKDPADLPRCQWNTVNPEVGELCVQESLFTVD